VDVFFLKHGVYCSEFIAHRVFAISAAKFERVIGHNTLTTGYSRLC